jgi:hypothetical protein
MMMPDRWTGLVRATKWWNQESVLHVALQWWEENRTTAGGLAASQWEALLRQGAQARVYADYEAATRKYLEDAAARDPRQTRWGRPGLSDSVLAWVKRAADLPDSAGFSDATAAMPPEIRAELKEWNRMQRAREFLSAVLLKTRIERKQQESQS